MLKKLNFAVLFDNGFGCGFNGNLILLFWHSARSSFGFSRLFRLLFSFGLHISTAHAFYRFSNLKLPRKERRTCLNTFLAVLSTLRQITYVHLVQLLQEVLVVQAGIVSWAGRYTSLGGRCYACGAGRCGKDSAVAPLVEGL